MNTVVRNVEGLDLPILVSPVIPEPFVHGFTTRIGGKSPAPFDSFNLGSKWGDAAENVAENWRRLRLASGTEMFFCVLQSHGREAVRVRCGDDPAKTAGMRADALVTDEAAFGLAVYVADCVPLVMVDPRIGACAAIHAGWRGIVGGVVDAAVDTLVREFGSCPKDLRVAIGPSIGSCCFEVGPEVVTAFFSILPHSGGVVIDHFPGKARIDLRRAIRTILEARGVLADFIDASAFCTRCDPSRRFFSYRRDGHQTGQQIAFVGRR
jgi:polyphenol oxidase